MPQRAALPSVAPLPQWRPELRLKHQEDVDLFSNRRLSAPRTLLGNQLEPLSESAHHEVHAIEDPTNPATLYRVRLIGEGCSEAHYGREDGLSRWPQILADCDPALPLACTASSLLLPPQRHALHGHGRIQYTRGMTAAWTAGGPRLYDTPCRQ
jgi:hypothetical protein